MKTVLIVRHAKSSWSNLEISDFDRPLNDRGKHDAPEMANRLIKKNISIDAFISSPAKRARKTAEIFAKEMKYDKEKIIYVEDLYHAGPSAFYKAIANAPAKAKSIALFSHNPGITEFANGLTQTRVDDMPTCAVFAVTAKIENWNDFKNAEKEFYFFDYPKAGHE